VGHFERKFYGEKASPTPTSEIWRQKTRVHDLSYVEKKIAENFNRLSQVQQRYRRQTDGMAIAYSERKVADVR